MNKPIKADEVEVTEELENEELEDQEEASEGEEGTDESETDDQENEIVLEGDDGSQPDQSNLGIRKRINKLNAKVSEARDGKDQADSTVAARDEEIKLLRLALEQQKEPAAPSGPPDPLDFDDGARDKKYIAALDEYTDKRIQAEVAKHVPTPEPQRNLAREAAQTRHYEDVKKLKLRDYDDTEDKAIEILGKNAVNILIESSDASPKILYHLGKNPVKAERIASLLSGKGTDPAKGILELGALGAKLKATTVKRNQAPNPDEELEGASSPRSTKRGPKGAKFE